ncbi:amidophosphoribosyltransferase [Marinobacterium zhoushanense]|uniref:Amidophosphoribosyltransferase n=1 Tax=Marinobacterium zhoushanense TaxID=1679163 RepID=A0ABQ1K934_9GAMM|nr:ComF family protein [Marinobacterium zhoushanense]GGB88347.1 amidophosphoribosyltransferase [Marinobacterium zhoushanense]
MKNIKSYYRLFFNQSCYLCQTARADTLGLCEACHADLPWLIGACRRCAEPMPTGLAGSSLCARCQRQAPAFDITHAAFLYAFPISQLIPAIKYLRRPEALGWLSLIFAQLLRDRIEQPPKMLLPVPMHPWRTTLRGFNQAELIAAQLGRHLGIPVRSELLRKRRTTLQQARLNRASRGTNLAGSFKLLQPVPEHVAVVDDVMTTGSTAEELARLLKMAGARRVEIWVLARTPSKG